MHYILLIGIYYWAGMMFVLLDLLPAGYHYFSGSPPYTLPVSKLVTGLITWPMAGYIFGAWTWAAGEKRFLRQGEQTSG